MNLVSLFVWNNFCQCKLTGVSEESLLSDLLEVGFRVAFLELLDK